MWCGSVKGRLFISGPEGRRVIWNDFSRVVLYLTCSNSKYKAHGHVEDAVHIFSLLLLSHRLQVFIELEEGEICHTC